MSGFMKTVLKKSHPTPKGAIEIIVFIAWSDFKAFRSHPIKVHTGDLVYSIETIFIIPVILIGTECPKRSGNVLV